MEFIDGLRGLGQSATVSGSTVSGSDLIATSLRKLQPVEPQGALLGFRPSEAQAQADTAAARNTFADSPIGLIHQGVAASKPVGGVVSAGGIAADAATPGKTQATLSGSELILHAITSAGAK